MIAIDLTVLKWLLVLLLVAIGAYLGLAANCKRMYRVRARFPGAPWSEPVWVRARWWPWPTTNLASPFGILRARTRGADGVKRFDHMNVPTARHELTHAVIQRARYGLWFWAFYLWPPFARRMEGEARANANRTDILIEEV